MTKSHKDLGISYREAVNAYLEFIHHTDMKIYTFDPVLRIGFCAATRKHAKEMHSRYSNGTDPLYVVGVTNHIGMPDDELKSAYNDLRKRGICPFFGRWLGAGNVEFTDISYPINHGVHELEILELKQLHAQKYILRINRNGCITFI